MPATRSTKSTKQNPKSRNNSPRRRVPMSEEEEPSEQIVNDNTTDKFETSKTSPVKRRRTESTNVQEPDLSDPKDKIKYLHYALRKACRKAIDRSDSDFDKDADLIVRLGESWEYTFDQSLDDLKVINDKFELEPDHVQDICRQVYHNCILITEGEKFKALLGSQGLDTESVATTLEQLCKTDGFTDADHIGGTMKKVAYQKLCKIYRDMAIEQVKTLHKKCFSKEMLQRGKGQLSGVRSVVHNTAEPISDSSKYAVESRWLATCAIVGLYPVRTVVKATSSDAEIVRIVESVKTFVAKHAQNDLKKVDDLWLRMVKAIYDIDANDTITDSQKTRASKNAEAQFESKLDADLLVKGRADSQNPEWIPTPLETEDFAKKYNVENDKVNVVRKDAEARISELVEKAQPSVERNVATIARTLQNQLVSQVSAYPFLKVDKKDGKIYTKV